MYVYIKDSHEFIKKWINSLPEKIAKSNNNNSVTKQDYKNISRCFQNSSIEHL